MITKAALLKYSGVTSGALAAFHVAAFGYVGTALHVQDRAAVLKQEIIGEVAESFGYQRPVETPDLQSFIEATARAHSIEPALVKALIEVESNWKPLAFSKAGAVGLMQVMPFNAKRCGYDDASLLLDPRKNISCGTKILAEELRAAKGDPVIALQSYNGGAKCVGKCAESINHARKVLTTMAKGG